MRILKIKDVIAVTGLSRTTIWRLERQNCFPKHLQLSANRVGWSDIEIQEWLMDRPRGTELCQITR